MRLTTKSEYSLLALFYIASKKDEEYVKIDEICDAYKISKKYLEQLLFILKRNGVLKTKRGVNGGYQLNIPPNEISIADVLRVMDGPLAPVESASKFFFSNTPLEKEQIILNVFREIRDIVSEMLENLFLEDLLENAEIKARPIK